MITELKSASPVSVIGCVAALRQARIEAALDGAARCEWFGSFDDVCAALSTPRVAAVILDARDASGAVAPTVASRMATRSPATAIVLYATSAELAGGALSSPAFADVLVAGESDVKIYIRSVLLNAVNRLAAERVVAALRARLSASLATFAESAVRHPGCASVGRLAEHLGMHRQTAGVWCRKERMLRPEELLMWCRVLLVAAVLEQTERSVSDIAMDLEFPSTVSLRNQLKRYVGMTALEIRAAGLDAVVGVFDQRIEEYRRTQRDVPAPSWSGPTTGDLHIYG